MTTKSRQSNQHKRPNPVAKNARLFNKATVQVDRKKAVKLGYRKHKGQSDVKAA